LGDCDCIALDLNQIANGWYCILIVAQFNIGMPTSVLKSILTLLYVVKVLYWLRSLRRSKVFGSGVLKKNKVSI